MYGKNFVIRCKRISNVATKPNMAGEVDRHPVQRTPDQGLGQGSWGQGNRFRTHPSVRRASIGIFGMFFLKPVPVLVRPVFGW
jgi:hypothetical protein